MLRSALAICLCFTLVSSCAAFGPTYARKAARNPLAVEVARVDADQAKRVDIVSQLTSAGGRELNIVLKPKAEQFTVDFDLNARDFQRVRITIQGAKKWDVARYFTDLNRRQVYIDLTRLKGVDFFRQGDDVMIDFTTPKAALVLPPDGRLLFREMMFEAPLSAEAKAKAAVRAEEAKKP